MQLKPGGVRQSLEAQQSYVEYFVDGLVATDGVQYSSVATVGTTAVEVFNKLIDPGYQLGLKRLEFSLTQRFTGLNGSVVGSIAAYYWRARTEWVEAKGATPTLRVGAWVGLNATLSKSVGTLTTSEDTLSGYVPVATLPNVPIRVSFMALGIKAADFTGQVKNTSYIALIGNVIPGT